RAGSRAGRPRRAGRGRVRHPRARPVAAAVYRGGQPRRGHPDGGAARSGGGILAARAVAAGRDDPRNGANARATVGRLVPVPGGTNVIASRVDAWLDLRGDVDAATRALLAEVLAAAPGARRAGVRGGAGEPPAGHGCALEVTEESYVDTVIFDPALRDRVGGVLG